MYRERIKPLSDSAVVGLYGSTRAGTFIKDVVAGTDSVDVITIGDSNTGYNNCGISTGFREALGYRGALQYATCLTPFADRDSGSNSRSGGTFTNNTSFAWVGNSFTGGGGGNSTISSLTAKSSAGDPNASALQAVIGTSTNGLRPNGFAYDAAFVNFGSPINLYTSFANGPRIVPAATTSFAAGDGSGGVPLQYRVVYATFSGGSGQFKLTVMRGTNTVVARSANPISTAALNVGISTTAATLNFNSPEVSNIAVPFACNVDGFSDGTTADYIAGPAAFLWHSLMFQSAKGYAVTNLSYYSGRSTANLASDVTGASVIIQSALRELRARQIAAGGSGRVLVLVQSGINDGATGASYTGYLDTMIDSIRSQWSTLGFDSNDLAFLITSTHPTPNSIGGENWFSNRPTFVLNAKNWAYKSATDGRNITYCDFGDYRTAAQMLAAYQYSFYLAGGGGTTDLTPYAVHLRTGLFSGSTTWTDSSVTSVPNPTPGGLSGWQMPAMSSENAYMAFGNYMVENLLKQ